MTAVSMVQIVDAVRRGPCALVTVLAVAGSTPREAGARMLIDAGGIIAGSIGGGRLEFDAIRAAREDLGGDGAWRREVRRIILGVDAGQCCGGTVEILTEWLSDREAPVLASLLQAHDGSLVRSERSGVPWRVDPGRRGTAAGFNVSGPIGAREIREAINPVRRQVLVYGAGHVARALMPIIAGLPVTVTWVDVAVERFPWDVPPVVDRRVGNQLDAIAGSAQRGAIHLVMTHDHDLDFAICRAALAADPAAFVGLIGSQTKRARFSRRLAADGLGDAARARLICPIGHASLLGVADKTPTAIAIAVAAQLLELLAVDVRVATDDEVPV